MQELMGTQVSAALAYTGGSSPPGGTCICDQNTEEYNGSGWSAGGTLNTAKSYPAGSAGTQTAALFLEV